MNTTPAMLAASPDFAAIKQRQQATWASGDFAVIGTTLQIVGESLAEAADVRAGDRVLDVAAGNGNATLAAALRFAEVTSTDYVPALLDKGRQRAAAEGLNVKFQVADAEELPFADGSFDVVLSTFGAMFTPDHRRPARERLRVTSGGGGEYLEVPMHDSPFSKRAAAVATSETRRRVGRSVRAGAPFDRSANDRTVPAEPCPSSAADARGPRRRGTGPRQRRHARRTGEALNQLDGYLLRDVGLDRSQIPSVAAGTRCDPRERLPRWMPTGGGRRRLPNASWWWSKARSLRHSAHSDPMKINRAVARFAEQLRSLPWRKTGDVQQTGKKRQKR